MLRLFSCRAGLRRVTAKGDSMKITGIEIKRYVLPLDPPFRAAWDPSPRTSFTVTVVKVDTDAGISGIGTGGAMEGLAENTDLFIGHDPYEIDRHWRVLDNLDFHFGRCWPLDIALWDIMGKAENKPVSALLNAGSTKKLAYASTGEILAPEERAERTAQIVALGFKAMKIRFHHDNPSDDIRVVEAVRKAVGDKLDIMVDANQGWRMPWDTREPWHFDRALQVAKELERLDVYWLEEPLAHDDFDALARLRNKVNIRIAGGEMNRRLHDFYQMNDRGSLDVYQPDVTLTGGITGVKRIASAVRENGAWFSPHTWGDGIALLANLHLACAVSDCPYIEFPFDPPAWTNDRRDFQMLPQDRLMIDGDGYIHIPEAPGLGCELDEPALARYQIQ